jgi:hypothetical protein
MPGQTAWRACVPRQSPSLQQSKSRHPPTLASPQPSQQPYFGNRSAAARGGPSEGAPPEKVWCAAATLRANVLLSGLQVLLPRKFASRARELTNRPTTRPLGSLDSVGCHSRPCLTVVICHVRNQIAPWPHPRNVPTGGRRSAVQYRQGTVLALLIVDTCLTPLHSLLFRTPALWEADAAQGWFPFELVSMFQKQAPSAPTRAWPNPFI